MLCRNLSQVAVRVRLETPSLATRMLSGRNTSEPLSLQILECKVLPRMGT